MSNPGPETEETCLMTVATDNYVAGTMVTIYSFLKSNSWFKGDIRVVSDRLSIENREVISALYDRVIYDQVEPELKAKVYGIANCFAEFERRHMRFFSLQGFGLRDYKKVIIVDSDLLFRGSVAPLLDLDDDLVAAGDGAYYHDLGRPWGLGEKGSENEFTNLRDTFNAGFMVVGSKLLERQVYQELIALIDGRVYDRPNIRLADQVVLNVYFANRVRLVSAKHNYLLAHRHAISNKEGLNPHNAAVVHFNGDYKPWQTELFYSKGVSNPEYLEWCGYWLMEFVECIQKVGLKHKFDVLRGTELGS